MKTGISTVLRNHLASGSPTVATCWKATLTNGTVVTATSLDRNIEYPIGSGVIYLATAAYTPTDIESSSNLSPDNLELEGFLRSPNVTESDMHSGMWDYAKVEIFVVNYKDLTMGRDLQRFGTLGEVKSGLDTVRAELRGLTQAFSRKFIQVYTKECRHDLGSTKAGDFCGVNLAAITVTGAVVTSTDRRIIHDATRTEELNWFTAGLLTFTSGLNAGISREVKYSAPGVIEMHEAFPFDIAVSDAYSVYAGCTKRKVEDCKNKHHNLVNFGGFDLPGNDAYGPAKAQTA